MPELPEVETIACGLNEQIAGSQIQSVDVFRETPLRNVTAQELSHHLQGQTIRTVYRRAKYLIFEMESGESLVSHLRMTGKYIVSEAKVAPQKSHRLHFHLNTGQSLIYDDVRCLGTLEWMSSLDDHPGIQKLGIEPLSADLTIKAIEQLFSTSPRPIKPLLMDQQKIVGIGNIYASELLYQLKISPLRPGHLLSKQEIRGLYKAIPELLHLAISKNGTSISDFRKVDDKTGEFQDFLKVYGKEGVPCPQCQTPILRITQQQRSSFYCPQCQT